jgi:hypothetical protein
MSIEYLVWLCYVAHTMYAIVTDYRMPGSIMMVSSHLTILDGRLLRDRVHWKRGALAPVLSTQNRNKGLGPNGGEISPVFGHDIEGVGCNLDKTVEGNIGTRNSTQEPLLYLGIRD